ncbi:MAG TPA: hypothetical protein VHE30_25925 [Polyangiaceae bacterium]|nr:hypothetical protein [Polyangiaceae bacterium]
MTRKLIVELGGRTIFSATLADHARDRDVAALLVDATTQVRTKGTRAMAEDFRSFAAGLAASEFADARGKRG